MLPQKAPIDFARELIEELVDQANLELLNKDEEDRALNIIITKMQEANNYYLQESRIVRRENIELSSRLLGLRSS